MMASWVHFINGSIEDKYSMLWCCSHTVSKKHHVPQRLEVGSSTGYFHNIPDTHHRHIYFEALDHATKAIHDHFNKPGYSNCHNLKELVLKVCKGEVYDPELEHMRNFYEGDLTKEQPETQLPLVQHPCQSVREITISEVIRASAERVAAWIAMKLLVVIPATLYQCFISMFLSCIKGKKT